MMSDYCAQVSNTVQAKEREYNELKRELDAFKSALNGEIYLVYVETHDYYHTHEIEYVGTDLDIAHEVMNKDAEFKDNYIEIWKDGKCVRRVWNGNFD